MLLTGGESAGMADFDIAIIGGGINGAGIARDAAGRRLRVLLVEQNDLASGTSSASTKLVHGGLRYLEHGAFRLVREALAEREVLWRIAPHLVQPISFVMLPDPAQRSAWLVRLGLFVYDHLGGRKLLPPTKELDLTHHPVGIPLQRGYRSGFQYSDCQVDDARLVVLNALDAAERGAAIRTRTRCVRAERSDVWRLVLSARGHRDVVTARVLVNAAGPWVGQVAESVLRRPGPAPVRLDKGSHIVVRRLFDHDCGYVFQSADRRIVFAIPFERDFTLIGTTDVEFKGDPASVGASAEEITYLCKIASSHFRQPISPEDVVWTFAGVRALYDDGSSRVQDATRDYHLVLDKPYGEAPLLTVYGGKITTYRRLAEKALDLLGRFFTPSRQWTAQAPLPGGDFPTGGVDALVAKARADWPFLDEGHARRLAQAYGTRMDRVLGPAKNYGSLGKGFGAGLTVAEVRYLMTQEWAQTAEDILWRRSKLGLRLSPQETDALGQFINSVGGRNAAE
jgi:glycerol-3-phosphate dehydrogenase